MEAKEIIAKISSITRDIYDYVLNTKHWLFYWIDNKEVQEFIKAYPDEYEKMVYLSLVSINAAPLFKITFEEHPDNVSSISRYAALAEFREVTKAKWIEWNGYVNELQISEMEKNLAYFKKKVAETEEEIKKLKSK